MADVNLSAKTRSEFGKGAARRIRRAGKVPARIIEQRVGKGAVMQEAVNAALPEFWAQAAAENELQPIGQPEVDVTEVPLEDSTQLTFTVAVDVRPEITLPDYASMTIEVDPVTVSDEDVEARMTDLRERFGSLTGVDRAVEDGDFVSIDLTASIDGEEIDSVEGISYEVGSKTMLEGLDEALVGLAKGESKDFTAPLAGGEHAGKDADCTVAVQSVKVRELPEVDDDFASMASEFDTVEELRADLTAQAEQQKKFEQGLQARDRLLDALLEQTEIAVPESIVEDEVKNHLEGEGRADDAEHRAEVEENTRKAIRTQFLLDEIVRVEEIEVGLIGTSTLVASAIGGWAAGILADRYGPLIEALYDGSAEKYIETEMTFEDGRKGVIRATVKVADAEVLPVSNTMPEVAE